VAIIGGGFTGAMVALNLLNNEHQAAIAVIIIEPRAILGAGLAYSTQDSQHRTNVPSSRLPIFPDAPDDYTNWVRNSGVLQADPSALLEDGRIFTQRSAFGRYVGQRLNEAASGPHNNRLYHFRARAVSATRQNGVYLVTLDSDEMVEVDILVIAASHPPPAIPAPLRPAADHKKFITDPWQPEALACIAPHDRVLIIGTALTAADVVGTLNAAGHQGKLCAISRRGLVSRQRRNAAGGPFGDFSTTPSRTALALLKSVRAAIKMAQSQGSGWAAVIEALRSQGTEIWQALPPAEKHRFLRHVRPFWDVHRYQIAPQLSAILESKKAGDVLEMRAARLVSAAHENGRFTVDLHLKGAAEAHIQTEVFDAIVNCTGPDHRNILKTNPVLAALAKLGLLCADEFGLGIATDHTARAINTEGQTVPDIFIAGPLARAAFGELMGVPQIAGQAQLVAQQILHFVA
jgi:uncharacterized NAD(P)/FAD-binding protein YdhS